MEKKVRVLGFAGSLRRGSYNRMLLRNAVDLAPDNIELEVFELDGIPPFNQDFEKDMPTRAKEFKSRVEAADAILIVTPEANYSIPGVLKNAIDWASRPYGDNSFKEKPAAIMSASISSFGGARAQYHLRQMMVFLEMHPVNRPEVMVPFAAQAFDTEGRLKDQKALDLVKDLLVALYSWTLRLQCQ
jgi:chromate reductase, NAD(P)H dehydrogenase (quinone)